MTKKQMNERRKAPVVMNDLDPDDFLFKQLAFTGGQKEKKKSKITR